MSDNVAKYIDHTLLKATATKEQIAKLCEEAKQHNFAAVCVNAYYTKIVAEALKDTEVKVCVVVGFPLGACTAETKAFETQQAVANGAHEIDMVINIGALKSGDIAIVENDIAAVVKAAGDCIVKVIIETCYLTDEEKEQACLAASEAGANFVKTSTGFGTGGATIEDVKFMKKIVGETMKVKAAGGVKNEKDARDMILAGADRIGTSAGVDICEGRQAGSGY